MNIGASHCYFRAFFQCIILALCSLIGRICQAQQQYVNCTQMCTFPQAEQILPNNPLAYISLPRIFQLTFEFQVSGNTNAYPILANVLEIWSVTLRKSLVRISLEPMYNSNQMTVFYAGKLIFHYGPATVFSDTDFTWFSLTIRESTLVFGNQLYSKSYPIPGGSVESEENILYASYIENTSSLSSGGQIRNILFQCKHEKFPPLTYPERVTDYF